MYIYILLPGYTVSCPHTYVYIQTRTYTNLAFVSTFFPTSSVPEIPNLFCFCSEEYFMFCSKDFCANSSPKVLILQCRPLSCPRLPIFTIFQYFVFIPYLGILLTYYVSLNLYLLVFRHILFPGFLDYRVQSNVRLPSYFLISIMYHRILKS